MVVGTSRCGGFVVWCVVFDCFVVRYRLGRAVANGYAQVVRGWEGKSIFSRLVSAATRLFVQSQSDQMARGDQGFEQLRFLKSKW